MGLRLDTPPAGDIVSLDDLKAHLQVYHDEMDTVLEALITSATALLDGYSGTLGRALLTQTWLLDLDRFPVCEPISIPLPPLQNVIEVQYYDGAGVQQILDLADCIIHPGPFGMLEMEPGKSWPSTQRNRRNAVTVKFVAGYGDTAAEVPSPIQLSIKLLAAHWYRNPDAVVVGATVFKMPFSIEAILAPFQMPTL